MARGGQSNARNRPVRPPAPPSGLNDAQRAVWVDTCKKQNAEWLDGVPLPMLRAYCVIVVGTETAEKALSIGQADGDNGPKDVLALLETYRAWLGELGRIARALRLTPQSRIRADKAENNPGNPWNDDDGYTD